MGIYITLKVPKLEDSITNLLDSFLLLKNLLIDNNLLEIEKLTIWKDGPNIAYGERLEICDNYEELKEHVSNVEKLNKLLIKHKLSKTLKKVRFKNYRLLKFIGDSEPYKYHIIGLRSFAIQLDGKLLLSNNHVPCYIKVLFNTGFEREYGNIYLETFSHFSKQFMDFLLNNPKDFDKLTILMKKISYNRIVRPLKIIIGEDQVNNLYSIGSVFFWYKDIQYYFADIDSFIVSINDTGVSESTYFLDQLGISDLFHHKILDQFKEFRRIYKLENLRESYSKAREMGNFLKKTADRINIPISLTHSFMGYSENCNPKKTALFGENIIKVIHEILLKTLQREKDIKKRIENNANRILVQY